MKTIDGKDQLVNVASKCGFTPLYRYLTTQAGFDGDITWNFNKFLVNADGQVVARFGSRTEPLSKELTGKIEELLR